MIYQAGYHLFMVFLWFSYGFPIQTSIFLWFSYGFPMVFLWFSYGFPIQTSIFPWFSHSNLHFPMGFPIFLWPGPMFFFGAQVPWIPGIDPTGPSALRSASASPPRSRCSCCDAAAAPGDERNRKPTVFYNDVGSDLHGIRRVNPLIIGVN